VPGEQPIDSEALAEAATDTARAEAERILERQVEAAPEEIEPTEMPTTLAVPPTSPAAKPTTPARGTPTAKAPTVGRTPAAAPAAVEASKKEESSGWFGCQVTTGGTGGALFVLIGVVGILVNRLRRKG
jgi:MYXO-CTERM domain-containing protein